ncbi:anti-sigma factor family protein [Planctomycetota bacterium]
MQCREAREELVAYLDGELGREREASVENHLAKCEACRAEREQLRFVGVLLNDLEVPNGPGVDFHTRLRARIVGEESCNGRGYRDRVTWLHRWRRLAPVAAAAAVFVAFGLLVFQRDMGRADREAPLLSQGEGIEPSIAREGLWSGLPDPLWASTPPLANAGVGAAKDYRTGPIPAPGGLPPEAVEYDVDPFDFAVAQASTPSGPEAARRDHGLDPRVVADGDSASPTDDSDHLLDVQTVEAIVGDLDLLEELEVVENLELLEALELLEDPVLDMVEGESG